LGWPTALKWVVDERLAERAGVLEEIDHVRPAAPHFMAVVRDFQLP
jgi:hypothetical protein